MSRIPESREVHEHGDRQLEQLERLYGNMLIFVYGMLAVVAAAVVTTAVLFALRLLPLLVRGLL